MAASSCIRRSMRMGSVRRRSCSEYFLIMTKMLAQTWLKRAKSLHKLLLPRHCLKLYRDTDGRQLRR